MAADFDPEDQPALIVHPASRTIVCRCDKVNEGIPGAYCGLHDRAAKYTGPTVHGGADPYGPGLAW